MAMTAREKKIAIGVGVTGVVMGLYQFVLTPYLGALDSIRTKTTEAMSIKADNDVLFGKQHRLKKVWGEITHSGLEADESAAETQAQHSILDWVDQSGADLTALKPERISEVNQFQVISFHVTANGSTPAVAKLLNSFETATVPVRVDDMQIQPRKEGSDDLTIQLSVSTLCLKPDADIATDTPVTTTGPSAQEQAWN